MFLKVSIRASRVKSNSTSIWNVAVGFGTIQGLSISTWHSYTTLHARYCGDTHYENYMHIIILGKIDVIN